MILASAVTALSCSIRPFLAAQSCCQRRDENCLALSGNGSLFLAPFAIKELATSGIPPLSIAQWMTFLMADGYYSVLCLEFAWILCPRKVSSICHTTMPVFCSWFEHDYCNVSYLDVYVGHRAGNFIRSSHEPWNLGLDECSI